MGIAHTHRREQGCRAARHGIFTLALIAVSCLASDHTQPADPSDEVQVATDAHDAEYAAAQAKAAANHAQQVAARTVDIAHGAHTALKRARDALRAVRATTTTTPPLVTTTLMVSNVDNNLPALVAQRLAPVPANSTKDTQVEQMQEDLQQLRKQLTDCQKKSDSTGGTDKSIEQMDRELRELEEMLRKFEAEEGRTGKVGPHDTLQTDIKNLKGAIARLEKYGNVSVTLPRKVRGQERGELRYRIPARATRPRVQLTPLADLDIRSSSAVGSTKVKHAVGRVQAPSQPSPQGTSTSGGSDDGRIDIDTEMPYGELEPFGREDTAQELTEASIRESDAMVDQLERAEVAEEKRAVFRALTRLRGAAITSFDGIARSQTGNIDEYNKVHQWRATHPVNHLASEESDVSKWAFPDDADF